MRLTLILGVHCNNLDILIGVSFGAITFWFCVFTLWLGMVVGVLFSGSCIVIAEFVLGLFELCCVGWVMC